MPIRFQRGEGAWLWDTEGRQYLDFLSGIAVCALGHCHPAVTAAVSEQIGRLVHVSNLYHIEQQEALASVLVEVSGMDQAFFCNSGAEANEAAIKLARSFGHAQGVSAPEVIVVEGAFHGRTLATLSASGSRKVQAGFEPLVQGFVRVAYDDLDAMETVARSRPNVVAVLVEPILGEGGIVMPKRDYLLGIRELCDRFGWLMMLDEVQTGMGRTGSWFAWQHSGASPDVMTVAKALGNGLPIGACLVRDKAVDVLKPGAHGSTFGGNPLVCAAALAVLRVLRGDNLLARAEQLGERLRAGLSDALSGSEGVVEVRGRGLMIGVELNRPCSELMSRALAQELLINVTAERVVRLLPPLILSDVQLERGVATLTQLIRTFCREK
jgi:acetylornithine aminotransferase